MKTIKFYKLPSYIFVSFFIIDFLSKIIHGDNHPIFSISSVYKIFIEALLLFFIIKNYRYIDKESTYPFILLLIFYFMGHLFHLDKNNFIHRLILNLKYLNWFLFVFLLNFTFDIIKKKTIFQSRKICYF